MFIVYVFIFLHEKVANGFEILLETQDSDVHDKVAHGYEVLLETQDSDVEVVLDIQMVCLKCILNFGLQKSLGLFSFPFWANGLWYDFTNMKEIQMSVDKCIIIILVRM